MAHNELGNIWTHLIPTVIIAILIAYFGLCISHYSVVDHLHEHRQEIDQNIGQAIQSIQNMTYLERIQNSAE